MELSRRFGVQSFLTEFNHTPLVSLPSVIRSQHTGFRLQLAAIPSYRKLLIKYVSFQGRTSLATPLCRTFARLGNKVHDTG